MKNFNFENVITFCSLLEEKLNSLGVDIKDFEIDHICYRTSSELNYSEAKEFFAQKGKLLIESLIGGRNIATYKLIDPIKYNGKEIFLIEVPSPKRGRSYSEGLEHFEVVVPYPLEDFIDKYPEVDWDYDGFSKEINRELRLSVGEGMSVKFHEQSLEKVIELEKKRAY